MDALKKVFICSSGLQHKLFVQNLENRWSSVFLNHVDSMLIIFERDTLPLYTLLLVLFLLQSKHVLVELLLKLLVCIVDAQLLEWILSKDLESKNIEQAYESQLVLFSVGFGFSRCGILYRYRQVNLLDNPAEDSSVEMFAEWVSSLVCLIDGQGAIENFFADYLSLGGQRADKFCKINA